MKIIDNREYLTIKELTEILHISRQAIFRKVKNGDIKAQMVGKTYIIPKKQLDGIFYDTLSDKLKEEIDRGVSKVIKEYGDVIKKLGEEKERYGSN